MKTEALSVRLLDRLKQRHMTLATAESCTGGGIGHALTAIPGSSAAYKGGVISYTNGVKEAVLGVSPVTLAEKTAVSPETAREMAEGVCRLLGADLGVSVTGLAGPDGDGTGKPVGLVYIGACLGDQTSVQTFCFPGVRAAVRAQAVDAALELCLSLLGP